MFLLVPAHPGCPGQGPGSHEMVVVVVVVVVVLNGWLHCLVGLAVLQLSGCEFKP